jgi:hypothetical protein
MENIWYIILLCVSSSLVGYGLSLLTMRIAAARARLRIRLQELFSESRCPSANISDLRCLCNNIRNEIQDLPFGVGKAIKSEMIKLERYTLGRHQQLDVIFTK